MTAWWREPPARYECDDPETDYAAIAAEQADRERDRQNAEADQSLEDESPTKGEQ
jgi:hypothetical protein